MQLSPIDSALNMQLTAMDADLHTYGFPPGYFVIRSAAANRVLDVDSDEVADDTELILYPETETSLVECKCYTYYICIHVLNADHVQQ